MKRRNEEEKNEQQIENYDNKITFQIRKKQEAQNLFHLF